MTTPAEAPAMTRLRSMTIHEDAAYQQRIVRSLYGRWLDLQDANPWRSLYEDDQADAIRRAVLDELDSHASLLLGLYGPDQTEWRRDVSRWGIRHEEMILA